MKKYYTKHGFKSNYKTDSDYNRWKSIKDRCYRANSPAYKNYGGRGIVMADYWIHNPYAFVEYIRSLPNYGTPGLTIDRINNDGNYEIGNLRWATRTEQLVNRRKPKTTEVIVTNEFGYETIYNSATEVANKLNININTLRGYLNKRRSHACLSFDYKKINII